MLNKTEAVTLLVEDRLPLFTKEIRSAFSKISPGPPNTSPEVVLELVKQHPDHFAELVFEKTEGHTINGEVIWTNPETGNEYRDVDIDIISRYLRIACRLDDYLYWSLPHDHFLKKYERFSVSNRKRLLKQGSQQDAERFFSFPDAMASEDCLQHWSHLPYLTSDECAALAMGRDPEIVSLATVETAVGSGKSPFLDQYRKFKRFFESHQAKEASHLKIPSVQFRRLMEETGGGPHQRGAQTAGTKTKEVSLPAIHSLYKLVLALAIKHYPDVISYFEEEARVGSVLRKPTGSVITQMEQELRPLISTISDGNIKEYVRRAYHYAKNERLLVERKSAFEGKIPEK